MHRLYVKGDITVFWDSGKCYHAKECKCLILGWMVK